MFKKSTYLITVREKGKTVFKEKEGYTFSVKGFDFGICKSGNGWIITEITSGLKIDFVSRRKDAIEEVKGFIPILETVLKSEYNQNLIKMKEEHEKQLAEQRAGNLSPRVYQKKPSTSRFETTV